MSLKNGLLITIAVVGCGAALFKIQSKVTVKPLTVAQGHGSRSGFGSGSGTGSGTGSGSQDICSEGTVGLQVAAKSEQRALEILNGHDSKKGDVEPFIKIQSIKEAILWKKYKKHFMPHEKISKLNLRKSLDFAIYKRIIRDQMLQQQNYVRELMDVHLSQGRLTQAQYERIKKQNERNWSSELASLIAMRDARSMVKSSNNSSQYEVIINPGVTTTTCDGEVYRNLRLVHTREAFLLATGDDADRLIKEVHQSDNQMFFCNECEECETPPVETSSAMRTTRTYEYCVAGCGPGSASSPGWMRIETASYKTTIDTRRLTQQATCSTPSFESEPLVLGPAYAPNNCVSMMNAISMGEACEYFNPYPHP